MLKGKVAVVTGSTSGIGLGCARALAEAGCKVVLNGRKMNDEAEELLKTIPAETGSEVMFGAADMAEAGEIRSMIGDVVKKWGGVDILINNAGIQHVSPIDEFPEEKWDQVLAINLTSAFHTTKAALPGMKKKGWGRIINIASAHGLVASAYKSAYVAAKHGIVGLTKVTALEVAEMGITANAICPGYVWTPLVEKQLPDQMKAHKMSEQDVIRNVLLANQPNKKFATTAEMGALAVFLSSDAAASITGTSIPVDGGWVAH
ncbi:3-hydroxybutyrate dehydrogenase [Oceanibacterium hippocampi]|uniref:D-beta-hydroxybutyrate dehydrogenase n=1 Tax=Oceanibacterium hippocampi TaxID=745714 RepID=A0A1Y5S1Z5_9PROT|nr:3-hydroxybutyrate dehydrogenase [Oceanibacterium hippocampi]SLN30719.1 D-beta-hydroxybutyrate dehydrogenase [Oceanibacterium hippocampi]